MKKKIGIIGRVAESKDLFDGQTIKTRNLKKILVEISDNNVYVVDTYKYKIRLFFVLIQTIICMFKCEKIVLSISINGRKFFFPFIYYLNRIFKREIYHSLIGGRLAENIKQYPYLKKYVISFKSNWVESKEIVENLNEIGVINAVYVPNFKKLTVLENIVDFNPSDGFKYCTFSRVQEKKGISKVIKVIEQIQSENSNKKIVLDIYGPIDEDYRSTFYQLIENKENINYMGCVDANLSVDIIKNYFMLLFPTLYYNEGIPGTIIDSLAAGTPIVASKWHYCNEMLIHMHNGLIYDFDDHNGLYNMIKYSIDNVDVINQMKKNCIQKSKEYMYDNALDIIKFNMNIK